MSAAQADAPLASIRVGDARDLDWDDASFDMVLLLGPLYHITEREDRILDLSEAYRVLKPGGVLLAAAISRFASSLDGLHGGRLKNGDFLEIVRGDLTDGHHHNPTGTIRCFTETVFHHPDELRQEVFDAGFAVDAVLGVERPSWLAQDFDSW